MPLTLAQLQDIQATTMADDVEIDLEKMSLWSEDQATAFFESGGAVEPSGTVEVSDPVPAAAAPRPAPTPLGRKPRIVLLHGTAGNKTIQAMQLSKLLKELRPTAELFFVEGELAAREDDIITIDMRKVFGTKHEMKEYARATFDERHWRTYEGIEARVKSIEKAIDKQTGGGGADVLIGFSQGSNLITCLCARAERGVPGALRAPPRAAVLLAPTNPGWARQMPAAFASPLSTPVVIGYSDTDKTINNEGGCGPLNTAALFESASARVLKNAGPGHRALPADKDEQESLVAEILKLIDTTCPDWKSAS